MIIYVLCDPETCEVRYVGKTVQSLPARLRGHLAESRNGSSSHRCNWIRSLVSRGLVPVIEPICLAAGDGSKTEQQIISLCRDLGIDLINGTIGGDGPERLLPEHRQKISNSLIGKPKSLEHCATMSRTRRGRKLTPETKARISATLRSKPLSPALQAALALGTSPSANLKRSETMKTRWRNQFSSYAEVQK